MCVDERQDKGTVIMQGEKVAKVDDLKYQGSTVHSYVECGREVKKVYRPDGMVGIGDGVAPEKRQEAEMDVAELKMLRFPLGVTRMIKFSSASIIWE